MQSMVFETFYRTGVIPDLEIDAVDCARPAAESLLAVGLPVIDGKTPDDRRAQLH
jgi:hypothetical protein